MVTKAEQIAGRDGEIHSESWLQIKNQRSHTAGSVCQGLRSGKAGIFMQRVLN